MSITDDLNFQSSKYPNSENPIHKPAEKKGSEPTNPPDENNDDIFGDLDEVKATANVTTDQLKKLKQDAEVIINQDSQVVELDEQVLDLQTRQYSEGTKEAQAETTHMQVSNAAIEVLQHAIVVSEEADETVKFRRVDLQKPKDIQDIIDGKLKIAGQIVTKKNGLLGIEVDNPDLKKNKTFVIQGSDGSETIINQKNIGKLSKKDREKIDKAAKDYHHHTNALRLLRANPQQYFVKFPSGSNLKDDKNVNDKLTQTVVQNIVNSRSNQEIPKLSHSTFENWEKGFISSFKAIGVFIVAMRSSAIKFIKAMQHKKNELEYKEKIRLEQQLDQQRIEGNYIKYSNNIIDIKDYINSKHELMVQGKKMNDDLPSNIEKLKQQDLTNLFEIAKQEGILDRRMSLIEIYVYVSNLPNERLQMGGRPFSEMRVLVTKLQAIVEYAGQV